jgi:Zn-dependent protease
MLTLRSGLPVGSLFGIKIRLDYSLLLIFFLLVFSLGSGVFPAWHPEWSPALIWGVSIGAAFLFFVSILLHELSHALVAKAFKIPVHSITLFLFGGIANIEHDPDSPAKEALMAGVGPITSIGLGIGFSVAAALLAQSGAPVSGDPMMAVRHMGPVATLLAWLGPVNIVVGVFNMLPGFPLDGGRVLRALLWALSKNLVQATRWAARSGQALAMLMILTGIAMAFGLWVPVLGSGLISGMWLVFIGWFLYSAAVSSYRYLMVRDALEGVSVARLMRRQLPPAVDATATLETLVDRYVMRDGSAAFPVIDAGYTTGVAYASDLKRIKRLGWGNMLVRDIVRRFSDLPTLRPEQPALEALGLLGGHDLLELPVVDDRQLVGFIGHQDIGRWLSLHGQGGGLSRLEPSQTHGT